jgi:hypothetical protein
LVHDLGSGVLVPIEDPEIETLHLFDDKFSAAPRQILIAA